MTRVALIGATGRMGQAIARVIADTAGVEVVAAYAHGGADRLGADLGELAGVGRMGVAIGVLGDIEADVAIDFTSPDGTETVAAVCAACEVPLVSGTTGLHASAEDALLRASKVVPVVHAPNMSVGVTVLFHLAELTASKLRDFDAEIVEMHHRHKVDAPSGTAVRLAEHVAHGRGLDPEAVVRYERAGQVGPRPDDEIGVMTLRGGAVVGDHTLHLVGEGERLELTHRAMDRSIFARGAVRAAKWIVEQAPGRYGMADVLGL
ncbi:MAG: 4-hydroxy-tetrahydrodipicolinate reductase [Sandaracinaceae bacterium]|nr:4-hydroxy-tetrahydrodipicolinate reductase [Sandaracinaceae bacterium]